LAELIDSPRSERLNLAAAAGNALQIRPYPIIPEELALLPIPKGGQDRAQLAVSEGHDYRCHIILSGVRSHMISILLRLMASVRSALRSPASMNSTPSSPPKA